MAETSSKRERDETHEEECEDHSKRHKSYNQILSILEDEEDESNQDLSSILTTLQQELFCDSTSSVDLSSFPAASETDPENAIASSTTSDYSPDSQVVLKQVEEEEDRSERVIRHLLEASDDELGIPHRVDGGDDKINDGDHAFAFCDGLWEFEEDETANGYTLWQSELFM